MFYTYMWLRYDGTPYYIGKGKGNRGFTDKAHRVKCPKNKNFIIIQEHPTEDESFIAEVLLIEYYGRIDLGTGVLANLTAGGEGSSGTAVSDETREKHRSSRLGKKHSEEVKHKIGLSSRGIKKRHCKLTTEHLTKLIAGRWPIPEGVTREQHLQNRNIEKINKRRVYMRRWRKANPEKERLSWEKSNNRRKNNVDTH